MWMILIGASNVTDVSDIVKKKAHQYTEKMQLRKEGIKVINLQRVYGMSGIRG